MNARHLEERRETVMGEEFVYYVTVFDDPIPAPSAEVSPSAAAARRLDATAPATRNVSTRPARTVRPTKAQYVNSLAASGPLTYAMAIRVNHLNTWARAVRNDWIFAAPRRLPRRLRMALARCERGDFAARYDDRGTLARSEHHSLDSQRRACRPALSA